MVARASRALLLKILGRFQASINDVLASVYDDQGPDASFFRMEDDDLKTGEDDFLQYRQPRLRIFD